MRVNKVFIEKHKYVYEVEKNGIKAVKLFKTNTGNFLFIPLDIIGSLSCSGFREMLNSDDINKQFAELGVQHQFKDSGFIIPLRYWNRIFIDFNDNNLGYLNQYKDIDHIFKEKQIGIKIGSLSELLKIKKLLPDHFSRINFSYNDNLSSNFGEYSTSEIIDDSDWSNLKFWEIISKRILSPDEFQFWRNVLRSKRTRFNLTKINLKFSLLSECLIVLSLCSDCPGLEFVELEYLEADAENEDEIVENAEREFRQKFGFINKLDIDQVLIIIE